MGLEHIVEGTRRDAYTTGCEAGYNAALDDLIEYIENKQHVYTRTGIRDHIEFLRNNTND